METTRLFVSMLIVGTLILFVGCKKKDDVTQESPAEEVQPTMHTENRDEQQPRPEASVESTTPEHEVVVIVREFLNSIEAGNYDRAIELGTPNEFKREGLVKTNEVFDFNKAEITEAYVGNEQSAVLTNSIPARTETVQFGLVLIKIGSHWLIRDVDMLPRDEAVEKWLAGFNGVEPNAKRIVGKD